MNMSFILLLFLRTFFTAKSEILTYESIYEELKSCQEQKIALQKKFNKSQEHDLIIFLHFNDASATFIDQLQKAIINLLNKYLEVTKNCDIQITSKTSNHFISVLNKQLILEFFQNAYIFNHCISNAYKSRNKIFEKYKYMIDHAVKNIEDIKENVHAHHQCRKHNKRCVNDSTNGDLTQIKCIDIILISNCLSMLEDYELVYNECFKYEEMYLGKTSYVFIALKLNKSEKRMFKYFQPWKYLTDINVSLDCELFYEVLYLEIRSPLGVVSFKENLDCVLGKKIVKKRREQKIESYKVCFETEIYQYIEKQFTVNSMQYIITCSDVHNNQNKKFKVYNPTFGDTENLTLYIIIISYAAS
ncbi:hypothetical protein COBT_001733, partial [Conglomerata obtusa]